MKGVNEGLPTFASDARLQVAQLIEETVRRNAELVDNMAALQRQVTRLRADAAGRPQRRRGSKKKTKLPAPPSGGSRSAAQMLEAEENENRRD